jgi:hypothetical protein
MLQVNGWVVTKDDGTLKDMPQLADVARPVVGSQHVHGSRGHILDITAHFHIVLVQQKCDEFRDILFPLSQGRDVQINDL